MSPRWAELPSGQIIALGEVVSVLRATSEERQAMLRSGISSETWVVRARPSPGTAAPYVLCVIDDEDRAALAAALLRLATSETMEALTQARARLAEAVEVARCKSEQALRKRRPLTETEEKEEEER